MARKRSSTSISLFPFLAVLMCTMGALILLLLVTTRKIRTDQEKQIPIFVEAAPEPQAPPEPVVIHREEELSKLQQLIASLQQEIETDASKLAELQKEMDSKQQQLAALSSDQSKLESEIKVLEDRKQTLEVAPLLQSTVELNQQHETLLVQLSEATERMIRKQQELATTSDRIGQRMLQLKERQSALIALRKQVVDAKATPTSGTKTLIEFSNSTGTTRTPIIIDVSDAGYDFLPTGIRITSRDMQGFPVNDNPLLSGVLALHRQRSGDSVVSEPYVLLLVRPDGCLPFYAAQRILSEARIHFGYELLTVDRQVAAGEPKSEEQRVLRESLLESLNRRQTLYAVLHRKAIEEMELLEAEKNGDSTSKRLTVRADGRLESSEELDGRRPMEGRFFAGGIVPPRSKPTSRDYQEYARRAAERKGSADALASTGPYDNMGSAGFGQRNANDSGFGDAAAGNGSRGGDALAGNSGGFNESGFEGDGTPQGSELPSQGNPLASKSAEPGGDPPAGSEYNAPERTAAGGTSPQWLASSSFAPQGAPSQEPSKLLTPAESALMTRSSNGGAGPSVPSGSSAASNPFGSVPGDETPPPPGPRRDMSLLDPDLQKVLESRRTASKDDSTPVGITVFLDEQHMTVGQRPAVFLSSEISSEALASLLTGINEEVAASRRRPREPLLPIVKFVVSPGGERWRIQLARELQNIGIPSAQIYSMDPYIVPLDDTGRATVSSLETVPSVETTPDGEFTQAESEQNGGTIQ